MKKKSIITDNSALPLWAATGLYLNQLFHTVAYSSGEAVIGLLHSEIPLLYSFCFCLGIWIISYSTLRIFIKAMFRHPAMLLPIFVFIELFSQIFSRGVIKFCFDMAIFFIVYYRIFIRNKYNKEEIKLFSSETLKLIHSEVLGVLRISVNILISVVGVFAISFAIQFLPRYYQVKTHNIMLWYAIIVIFIFSGIYFLICQYLFRTMIYIRETFTKHSS